MNFLLETPIDLKPKGSFFNKNFLIAVTLLFLVGSAANASLFYWQINNNQVAIVTFTPRPTPTPTQFDYVVEYTENGFNPNILKINLGQKIEFKNLSNTPMWPASDPHPTHTDYPQFDADYDYDMGESYIFQFDRLGTFGYHNHDKSIDRGFIQVIDPTNPLPEIDKTKESQRATRDKFMEILKPGDPSSVYKLIDAINKNPAVAKDCHDMSHDWGHRAYELYGFSGAMTYDDPNRNGLRDMDHICAGGYMHGIIEELFLNQPNLKDNPNDVCSNVSEINRGSCYHGVGHALMFVYKRDTKASLATCKILGDFVNERRCYEGVFMELYWGDTDHAGANTLGWDQSKPLDVCIHAEEDQKPDCFLYAHLGYLRVHPRDFKGAINFCTKSNLGEWDSRYCMRGIGITMMKHFTSHRLELTESLVEGLNNGLKQSYYEGVIGYSRLSSVSEKDITIFCNLLLNDAEICLSVQQNYPK